MKNSNPITRWMARLLRSGLMLCGPVLLSACLFTKEPVKVAGGDDVPNSVEPLGKKSAAARNDSTDWNGFKSMPRTSPGMYDTTHVPDSVPDTSNHAAAKRGAPSGALPKRGAPLAKRASLPVLPDTTLPKTDSLPLTDSLAKAKADSLAKVKADSLAKAEADSLAKVAAAGKTGGLIDSLLPVDTVVTHVVDTAKGTVEAVHTVVKDSTRRVDSTVFVPVDTANPGAPRGVLQVTGKLTFPDPMHWTAYSFADADGDGFLAPRAGSKNLADVKLTTQLPTGVAETLTQRIAAGKDLNFNARTDNQIVTSLFVRTLGNDTLDVYKLLDADGDSVVLDFTKDTNIVDLIEIHHLPSDNLAATVTRKVRLVVFSKDSTRNYAVRFSELRIMRDGGVIDILAKGLGADSNFLPGKDALWIETHTRPSADSIETHAVTYHVRLAQAPGAFQGDVLLSLHVDDKFRASGEDHFLFDFLCDAPVADGRWLTTGSVQSRLTYRGGAWVSFDGSAVSGGLDGRAETSDGISLPVFFDRNGVLVKKP